MLRVRGLLLAVQAFVLPSLLLSLPGVAAAVPNMLGYNGRLTAATGQPLTGTYDFAVRIFTEREAGTLLFEESIPGVTVTSGYFDLVLSTNEVVGGDSLAVLALNYDALFIELEVNGETLAPRQELAPTAWALRSRTVWQEIDGIPASLNSLATLSCPKDQYARSNGAGGWTCTRAINLATCFWSRTDSTSSGFVAYCPAGTVAISGGCEGGGATVTRNRPSTGQAPGDGAPPTSGWACWFEASASNKSAFALCCEAN